MVSIPLRAQKFWVWSAHFWIWSRRPRTQGVEVDPCLLKNTRFNTRVSDFWNARFRPSKAWSQSYLWACSPCRTSLWSCCCIYTSWWWAGDFSSAPPHDTAEKFLQLFCAHRDAAHSREDANKKASRLRTVSFAKGKANSRRCIVGGARRPAFFRNFCTSAVQVCWRVQMKSSLNRQFRTPKLTKSISCVSC